MKWRRGTILFFVFGICLFINIPFPDAQELPVKLTLLHSNNINGEIDPCPT